MKKDFTTEHEKEIAVLPQKPSSYSLVDKFSSCGTVHVVFDEETSIKQALQITGDTGSEKEAAIERGNYKPGLPCLYEQQCAHDY